MTLLVTLWFLLSSRPESVPAYEKLGCLILGLSRYSYRPSYQLEKKGWKLTGGPDPGGGS